MDGVPDGRQGREQSVDRDLVEAAQRGDQAAFVDLVRSRGDRLFAIAYRILRDVDRAEDALQDALVIAWRDLQDLRDPDRFDAWVHRLLTNVCIAAAGRERRRASNLRLLLPVDHPAAPDELLSVADRDQLDRGFRRLTADERAILVLRHFVGYEPIEIAEMLGVSPGTIRSRLHHAHRAMRAALDADARSAAVGGSPA
jgi:RNA polymerase sigma-70 factor (ECF subfamily)